MKAKVNVGNIAISLPVEYLSQQTAISSAFDNVPIDSVDMSALIEANRTLKVSWYHQYVIGEDRKALHITIPTELIKWEDWAMFWTIYFIVCGLGIYVLALIDKMREWED